MIQLKLKPNADDKLTLKQIFDGFGSDSTPADPFSVLDASSASDIVNVAVPPFDLKAAASLNNGAQLVQGIAHVQWDNILTGTPQLSADGNFSSQLLAFDFDPSNPAAMFTQLMDILGPITPADRGAGAVEPVAAGEAPGDQQELRRPRRRVHEAVRDDQRLRVQPVCVPADVRGRAREPDRRGVRDPGRRQGQPRRDHAHPRLGQHAADGQLPALVRALHRAHRLAGRPGLQHQHAAARAAQPQPAGHRRARQRHRHRRRRHLDEGRGQGRLRHPPADRQPGARLRRPDRLGLARALHRHRPAEDGAERRPARADRREHLALGLGRPDHDDARQDLHRRVRARTATTRPTTTATARSTTAACRSGRPPRIRSRASATTRPTTTPPTPTRRSTTAARS